MASRRPSKKKFRRRRRVPLVLAVLFALGALSALILVPGFCGSQRLEDRDVAGRMTGSPGLLVPVAHVASLREDVTKKELSRTPKLAVPKNLSKEVGKLLSRPGGKLRDFGSAAEVVDHVSRTPDAVGLVPWDAVSPRVKALSVDGETLIGPKAAASESYPLKAGEAAVPDPKELRRIVVAGDIVLDRGQNYMAIQQGMGLDFALAGGSAEITSRTPEESEFSEFGVIHQFTAERRTEGGEVKEYLNDADLTLANLENPVKRDAVYHPHGTVFNGDLRLLPIVTNAGVDGVTLGNNHILDAEAKGLRETLGHLDAAGIRHAGAGPDLASSREPMLFDLGGVKVGVLSYQGVPTYDWTWATDVAPGTAPMVADVIVEDVKRLRSEVDLLLVMPHWGNEYLASPEPEQIELAHQIIDAGADLIVGHHAHWPKGVEMYGGKPIFYGTGNFLFDQSWSEETSTGIFVEASLYKDRIVQTRPVPFIVLDNAQPNFLVPEAGGDRALKKLFSASLGPEFESYKVD